MTRTNEPVFKSIFGDDWARLPRVFHRHYACRMGMLDTNTCDGVMEIHTSFLGRLLAPLFYLTGTLVPYAGKNIRATVQFESAFKNGQHGLAFHRVFYFPGKKPYRFKSVMLPSGGNTMTEHTRLGFGWHAAFIWTGEKIEIHHRGYTLNLWGKSIPFPAEWFLGRGHASETPLDDDRFAMDMDITHPLWGRVFGYSGVFTMNGDISA